MTTSPTDQQLADPWIEFRVSFGQMYARQTHPRWAPAHPNGWLTVRAVDEIVAREVLRDALDGAYAMIYHPAAEGYPRPGYGTAEGYGGEFYPLGQLGELQAFRGPNGEPMWRWIRTSAGVWEGPADDAVVHAAPPSGPVAELLAEHSAPWQVEHGPEGVPLVLDADGNEIELADDTVAANLVAVVNAATTRTARPGDPAPADALAAAYALAQEDQPVPADVVRALLASREQLADAARDAFDAAVGTDAQLLAWRRLRQLVEDGDR